MSEQKLAGSETGALVARHRQYFLSGATRSREWREVRFDPLGVGLIIGTWNYPVMLTLSPLIAAISGGNAAVIKPSEVSAATAEVIARLVPEYMDRNAFSVVLGG